jgi:hypothetical protein
MNSKVTIVTGLWNLGRGQIDESFKRSYDDYLEKFANLLRTDANMFIYISLEDEEFIWKHRNKENTCVRIKPLSELRDWFEFSNRTNELRQQPDWYNQAGWLPTSPQATLEMYNPVVMSKMFLLNDATVFNPFNSEYFFWLDAGICNTVHPGYFYHDKVLDNLPAYCYQHGNFIYLRYPYDGGTEIHGFPRPQIAEYCNTDYVSYVCRGGFFGGKKEVLNDINSVYYGYLQATLTRGLMGTEESIFTIIAHTCPDLVHTFELEDNGLVWPFFEKLKNYSSKNQEPEVGLYVITYNSPSQFEKLCMSFEQYDSAFLTNTKKYLLNNSLDRSTDSDYAILCEKFGFEEIKKDNLGICGGRQFIAEHFAETPQQYYYFFEDDMFFHLGPECVCRNGFSRVDTRLFIKVLEIMKKEEYDFLKLNFTEFYGDNSTQWSWYNVPQAVREEIWPDNCTLPVTGQSRNAPKTIYNNIKSNKGLAYAEGQVYYSNWPQIVSKLGNKKMFLDTKWQHPYEQTWMSYMFQETLKGTLKSAILLATPTEHNRFDHYPSSDRREH